MQTTSGSRSSADEANRAVLGRLTFLEVSSVLTKFWLIMAELFCADGLILSVPLTAAAMELDLGRLTPLILWLPVVKGSSSWVSPCCAFGFGHDVLEVDKVDSDRP